MNRLPAALILITSLLLTPAVGGPPKTIRSGLQPGETVGSFHVQDVTGPAQGTSLCYACRYGSRPVINVFVREMTDNVIELVQRLDEQARQHKAEQLEVFVVLLSLDPESDRDLLIDVARKHAVKHVPLTIFDGLTGPPQMKIAQQADVTVMLWNETKVQANHAFTTGTLDDTAVKAILRDIPKLLK